MKPLTIQRHPPEAAPENAPVLVAGGIAARLADGRWLSGMTDDPFTRELSWTPTWWAAIPQDNEEIEQEQNAKTGNSVGNEGLHDDC
jgi:hypothetical protein